MSQTPASFAPLPAGRHHLTREEVESSQRGRILSSMVEVAATVGYADASVSEVIKRAGVSRRTFYELFTDRLDCFIAAYDQVTEILVPRLAEAVMSPGTRSERLAAAVTAYLELIAAEPNVARVLLIEGFAAGPAVATRRTQMQENTAALAAEMLELKDARQRFAISVIINALIAMVTNEVATNDLDGVGELREPMLDLVEQMAALYDI